MVSHDRLGIVADVLGPHLKALLSGERDGPFFKRHVDLDLAHMRVAR